MTFSPGTAHHTPVPSVSSLGDSRATAEFLTQSFLEWLLEKMILLPDEWAEVPPKEREELSRLRDTELLLDGLVERHLLTSFQSDTIKCGFGDDLIVGHYRLMNLIGRGGMGAIYRAEHIYLRRQVAVKILIRSCDESPTAVERFTGEARAVAHLQHPNIVACFDAGRSKSASPTSPIRDFFVMELIPGQDLFYLIRDNGPLAPRKACEVFRQIADALSEAHRLGLVHRDIKPSNILITPDWKAKVLDFGLARVPNRQMTAPGTLLGTIGYMAPEQLEDPTRIDARADLFALGTTMYWALTGREPYADTGNVVRDVQHRLTASPPSVQVLRPEIPAEVSDVVTRLMELDPAKRFPTAQAVASTLSGLCHWLPTRTTAERPPQAGDRERVLVVDDNDLLRRYIVKVLSPHYDVLQASNGASAIAMVKDSYPALLIVDVNMPGLSGPELIAQACAAVEEAKRPKTILISGDIPEQALAGLVGGGADDFLTKPFSSAELLARIRTLLARRGTQAVANLATATMRIAVGDTLRQAHRATTARNCSVELLAYTVSRLLAEIGVMSDGHCVRLGQYVRLLGEAVTAEREYARLKNDEFVSLLASVAPLYDIGKMVIPQTVLLKPDRLSATELAIIQSHTVIGADLVLRLAGRFAAEAPALPLAAEITRSHHERWNGAGYPDELRGAAIPLSARVIAVASVYESLRTRRPHRPPLNHTQAVRLISGESGGQFDPEIVAAFIATSPQFERLQS